MNLNMWTVSNHVLKKAPEKTHIILFFSFFFQLSGLTLVVVGGVIQGVYSQYLDFLGDQFFNAPVLLVVVGCLIFFVTFFGCCGAIKENHCMTITFSVLLALIFLLEMGAGIGAYMLRDKVKEDGRN
jgi:CD63 antigen